MTTQKQKKAKKKAKRFIIAATAASSAIVGATFDDIPDIIEDSENDSLLQEDEEKATKQTLKAKTKALLKSLPLLVRVLILVPLYIIGYGLSALISPLWEGLASTVGKIIIHWVIVFLLVAALFVATAKILFPDVPLKKILNKKTLPILVVSVIVLAIFDEVMDFLNEDYQKISGVVEFLGSLAAVVIPVVYIYKKTRFQKVKVFTDQYQFEVLKDS